MPAADALAVLDAIPADQVPAAVLRLTARLVAVLRSPMLAALGGEPG